MTNGKFALAQKEAKITEVKRSATKKRAMLDGPLVPNTVTEFLEAVTQVAMIVPAIVIGILSAIGSAFETGLKVALSVYKKP